jgi:hypothetical protein
MRGMSKLTPCLLLRIKGLSGNRKETAGLPGRKSCSRALSLERFTLGLHTTDTNPKRSFDVARFAAA